MRTFPNENGLLWFGVVRFHHVYSWSFPKPREEVSDVYSVFTSIDILWDAYREYLFYKLHTGSLETNLFIVLADVLDFG